MYKELEEVLSHFVNRKLGTVGISFHRKPISLYVIIQNFATLMFGEDIIVGFYRGIPMEKRLNLFFFGTILSCEEYKICGRFRRIKSESNFIHQQSISPFIASSIECQTRNYNFWICESLISKPRFFVFSPKQFLIQNYGKIEFELYKEIK